MEQVELNIVCRAAEESLEEIKSLSGVDVNRCYQCGTCAAGCPVTFASDYTPRQVLRMLQLGLVEDVFRSKMIWLCVGCNICATRCPRQLDIPHLNDTLRILSKDKGFMPAERTVEVFNDLFLDSVQSTGRMNETSMTMGFNMRTRQPFKDVLYGPKMFFLGKLNPLPTKIKGTSEMKRIFAKIKEYKGGKQS